MTKPPGDNDPRQAPGSWKPPFPPEKGAQQRLGRSGRDAPGTGKEPGWANGLRALYNSVLHEPLPGTFDDLLKKLDKDDDA